MAIIPKITVTQVDNVPKGSPGIAGKVAIVAEFSKSLSAPISVNTYANAVAEATTGTHQLGINALNLYSVAVLLM